PHFVISPPSFRISPPLFRSFPFFRPYSSIGVDRKKIFFIYIFYFVGFDFRWALDIWVSFEVKTSKLFLKSNFILILFFYFVGFDFLLGFVYFIKFRSKISKLF